MQVLRQWAIIRDQRGGVVTITGFFVHEKGWQRDEKPISCIHQVHQMVLT